MNSPTDNPAEPKQATTAKWPAEVSYFKRVGLILGVQAVLMAAIVHWEHSDLNWLSQASFLLSWLVPFIAYIVALYNTPVVEGNSKVMRMAALTIFSFMATAGGSVAILILFVLCRVPVRG